MQPGTRTGTGPVRFRSEIGPRFVVVSGVFLLLSLWPLWNMLSKGQWLQSVPLTLGILLWVWLATTSYTLVDGQLLVVSGPVRRSMDIGTIQVIRPTSTMLAAPALSHRRIEVVASTGQTVIISPADRPRFLAEILARNPTVRLEGLSADAEEGRSAPIPRDTNSSA